jgi:hypothetical protein
MGKMRRQEFHISQELEEQLSDEDYETALEFE